MAIKILAATLVFCLGSGVAAAQTYTTTPNPFGGGYTTSGPSGTYTTTPDPFGGGSVTTGPSGYTARTTANPFGGGSTTTISPYPSSFGRGGWGSSYR